MALSTSATTTTTPFLTTLHNNKYYTNTNIYFHKTSPYRYLQTQTQSTSFNVFNFKFKASYPPRLLTPVHAISSTNFQGQAEVGSGSGSGSVVGNETDMSMLDKAIVFDLNGNGVPISDLWNDRKAVVAFARHFGCVFCRKRADYLAFKKSFSHWDAIRVAEPKFRSNFAAKFPISTTQSRSNDWKGKRFSCSCSMVVSEQQPASTPPLPVKIVSIFGDGSISPLRSVPWEDVLLHTAERLKWIDEGFDMVVFNENVCISKEKRVQDLEKELLHSDILLVVSVNKQESVEYIQNHTSHIPNVICFESSNALVNKLGGILISGGTNSKTVKEKTEVVRTITEAWDRHNSDDIRFALLIIINAYLRPVSVLQNLRSKGFSTLSCMVKNCGSQILNCLLDPACRKALQCLNKCSPVDQVCNYRCIASYESQQLEAFSLCVLQKHNCLQLDAKIPEKPYVPPMIKFRGSELCHETAEDLFVGWLGNLDWSWRVVAGQNPAYDQFPCQYQLFYRGKAKGSFWYEPVFQVRTLDGRIVWRRRRYRVKRGSVPGKFFFSVLDNGVVSNESWTIVDVADDLSWGLFHYHGAARVAGQSYTGAVLVSPNGRDPSAEEELRLSSALEKCGIKKWELFTVDNCSCDNPPLGIPEGSSLHYKIKVEEEKPVG